MPRDREAIADIIDSMQLIALYLRDITQDQFESDQKCIDSVVRRIEIIGEATKRLSPDVRERFRDVRWQDMAGMRDRVIHGYDSIDLGIVWDTATKVLPSLQRLMDDILKKLDK